MSIYIDNANIISSKLRGNWCHMVAIPIADIDNLHLIANKIGLKREWYQSSAKIPHYDVVKNKIKKAIKLGVIEVSTRELIKLVRKNIK